MAEKAKHTDVSIDTLPDVMTAEQVATYLQLRVSTVGEMARRGDLPSIKIGRHRRFRRGELGEWLDRRTTPENPYRR